MKKLLHLFIITFLTAAKVMAGAVSIEDAKTVASNFYNQKVNGTTARSAATAYLQYTRKETDGTIDFYVFSFAPAKGFVILSANDNLTPVIAYSTESNFNTQFLKTGLNDWMAHAASHIYTAIKNNSQANGKIAAQWNAYKQGTHAASAKSQPVGPLLTTTWGQDSFYNQLCPYNITDQQTCETGCVATAMAQIMKYWNYPAQGTGQLTYGNVPPNYLWNYGNQSANFANTAYQWNLMPNQLSDTNSSVATLMRQCGVAVEMSYGDANQGGSGAYTLASEVPSWKNSSESAYADYFNYNPNSLQGIIEAKYTATAWVAMLKTELAEGRPVQYVGYDAQYGGHAWVLDGYDENDMFHMNWGWNGLGDGFFNLGSLCSEGFNFSTKEAALIGIQPNVSIPVQATASNLTICSGENVTLISRGPALSTYSWYPADGLACSSCASTIASPKITTTYIVTVDSAGILSSVPVTVNVKAAPVLDTILASNVHCNSGTDGSVNVLVLGDNSLFTYAWSSGQASPAISNLSAGTYFLTVSDTSGCSLFLSSVITEPAFFALSVTATNATCNDVYGKAVANVTGGTPDYFYAWSNGAKTDTVLNLEPGNYQVTVADNNACSTSASVTINAAHPIEVITSIKQATQTSGGSVAIEKIAFGVSPYRYVWSTGDTDRTLLNALPGAYAVIVTDSNGCYQSVTATVGLDSVSTSTGITNTSKYNNLNVYPNPATTKLFIEMTSADETTLKVRNSLGQVLINRTISGPQTQVDVSDFATGVYFIEVGQDGETLIKEFIKN